MKGLIETIVKPLVDHPEELRIEENAADHSITYRLYLHQEDVGKVIGKQGKVAKAIRTVVYAAALNQNKRIYLEIM
jgi:uncharacterized protein